MKNASFQDSLRHAFAGIGYVLRSQRNARIHLAVALAVTAAGLFFGLDRWEWAIVALTIGFVFVAETLNTVLETAVDLTTQEIHPLARIAKDAAAGAVLLAAATAVVVGLLILGPHLVEWLL